MRFGTRRDIKHLDESHLPFEAAGTPLHSCRYIAGAMLDGRSLRVSSFQGLES